MNLKRKLVLSLSIITIITFISTAIYADPPYIAPMPIRDSIVEKF
ncbi:hypothetical protein [Schnuerera sp.]|nr:hypothetical protein [Schnuerera sp.]HSH34815.1 hypothetical protein [Schnuerera sp.]